MRVPGVLQGRLGRQLGATSDACAQFLTLVEITSREMNFLALTDGITVATSRPIPKLGDSLVNIIKMRHQISACDMYN